MRRCTLESIALVIGLLVGVSGGCKRGGSPVEKVEPVRPRAYTGDDLLSLEQQGTPQPGGTLVVAMPAEPPSLNAQLDPLDAWGKKISWLIGESLARPDPKDWTHQPRLAERWEISPDKRKLTFFLRKDVRWHDGQPFTADDVIFTFDKIFDPTSKTIAIRSYLEPISRYEKRGPYEVVFELKQKYWLAFDAIAEILIYPRHVYQHGDFNTHPANREPIGTGRFRLERWKTGDEIVLKRNDDFFGAPAHLDRIVFKYISDPTVRIQLLRRGDVNVVESVSPEEWRQLTSDSTVATQFWRLRHVPSGLQWIGWNGARPMFRDARVRRALTMLLDRRDIVENLRLGLDEMAASWFYPGTREYDSSMKPLPYDPKRARRLLDEAGWKDHDGDGVRDKDNVPFRFTFLYPAGPSFYEQLASLMTADYRQAGIEVEPARVEWAVYTERLRKHEFDACSLLWQMTPRNDPYQIWHCSGVHGGSNFVSFCDREADRLMTAARAEFDESKRVALYRRFNEILHRTQPYTMLFNRYALSLVSRQFGGIRSTPFGILSYGDIYRRSATDAPATETTAPEVETKNATPHTKTAAPKTKSTAPGTEATVSQTPPE